ncbi:MAG TPA: VOC family protein [Chloroflexota bacterium]|nr:VOC family protein [Chloroflexota bacterium]
MSIALDHTIVPARDKVAAARFFAEMFGLPFEGVRGPFAPVPVNAGLTLDFDDAERFEPHHYGFLVSEEEFDAILGRVRAAGVPHGAGPESGYDGQLYYRAGGRGVYFVDPNGHSYEAFTRA